MRDRHASLALAALLAVVTVAAFWPALGNGFVDYDDNLYVTENAAVQAGLTVDSVAWAFSTGHAANWHPLTWLSHQLDWELWGGDPRGHHATSLVLHLGTAVLLFGLLLRLTGARGRSAVVAFVFAVHPLRVESVAWVSERKDVLAALFWVGTTWLYLRWVERRTRRRYLAMCLAFACGLMSKPMLVTLPATLVLLDLWPLRRLEVPAPGAGLRGWWVGLRPLLREKWPLFALVVVSSVVTVIVQQSGGAVQSIERFSLVARVCNALVAYASYVLQTLWPTGLAAHYPFPASIDAVATVAAAVGIALVSVCAVRTVRTRPWLLVGWLWFVGTLVPVIGLVQVGGQAMADRYSYVPSIGLLIAIVWGVAPLVGRWSRRVVTVGCATLVLGLGTLTWFQTQHWRDGVTLFTHTLAVTRDNALAHNNLGYALTQRGEFEAAVAEFERALAVNPGHVNAWVNLGQSQVELGRLDRAQAALERALTLHPDHPSALANLGACMFQRGNLEAAQRHVRAALAIDPGLATAHNTLGALAASVGELDSAIERFEAAVRLNPSYLAAWRNLALAYAQRGRDSAAAAARSRFEALQAEAR